MDKFSDYINEVAGRAKMGGRAKSGGRITGKSRSPRPPAIKMLTIGDLVKILKIQKNWDKYQESIISFFEKGDWSKGDYVSYDVLELMHDSDDYQDEYEYEYKKSVHATIDKRLRGALKKLDKEFIVSKGACYKEIKSALQPDGNIFDDIVYAILDSKKNAGVKVEYPELKHYRDVEIWMEDYNFTYTMSNKCSKDDLCLLMTEGIESISISKEDASEYISVGGRTSTWTSIYKVDIVTYSTNKVISFEVSKTDTRGL